jgi:NADH dehydrogenase FAD-containing subunit
MAGKTTVCIIGAGWYGTAMAQGLEGMAGLDVVVVERKKYFVNNLGTVRGVVEPAYAERLLLQRDFAFKKAKLLVADVARIDYAAHIVHISNAKKTLRYDYLVLATGARYNFPGKIPWWFAARGGKRVATKKYDALHAKLTECRHIVVIGGGPVGCEVAGELATDWLRHRGDGGAKTVTLVHSRAQPLDERTPDRMRRAIAQDLRGMGCHLVLGERALIEYVDVDQQPEGSAPKDASPCVDDQLSPHGDGGGEAKTETAATAATAATGASKDSTASGDVELVVDGSRDSTISVKSRRSSTASQSMADFMHPLGADKDGGGGGGGGEQALMTDKGTKLPCDMILTCAGPVVNSKLWAHNAKIQTVSGEEGEQGLVVNAHLQVQGIDDGSVFAIGDCVATGDPCEKTLWPLEDHVAVVKDSLARLAKGEAPRRAWKKTTTKHIPLIVSLGRHGGRSYFPTPPGCCCCAHWGPTATKYMKSQDFRTPYLQALLKVPKAERGRRAPVV